MRMVEQKVVCAAVVASGGDAAPVLEFGQHVLDPMALPGIHPVSAAVG